MFYYLLSILLTYIYSVLHVLNYRTQIVRHVNWHEWPSVLVLLKNKNGKYDNIVSQEAEEVQAQKRYSYSGISL